VEITTDHAKTGGFILAIVLAALKGLQWLFTDKTKVALLEQRLAVIEEKLDDLAKSVTAALDKGNDRMQKHEDEIKGLQIQAAKLSSHQL
jgi:hypothetical protein